MCEPLVPEELAHMGPVLLFTVGIVVLAISTTARPGQLRRSSGQMPIQRPIEELPTIISMEVFHDIRHHLFQLPQLHQHRFATLVPNGPILSPTTEKLSKGEGIYIIPFGRVIAMGYRVRFDRTRPGGVRRLRTGRHRPSQHRPWPR